MGYVADRWHKSRPGLGEKECGEHKGRVPSKVHGKGLRWQARYDGPDGKERTQAFKTRAEAEAYVQEQETALRRGSWLDPSAGDITVEEFTLTFWLPAQAIESRTRYEYLGIINRYLLPELGSRPIKSIRPSEAGAWQALLTSKYELGGTTPNKVARLVRGIFRLAVIDRVIPVSPFEGIKAPIAVETEVHPPDIVDVALLIEHAYHDRWKAMVELDALTGLRSGEIRGLDVRRIDFLRRQMHLERQLVYEPDKGMYFDDLKTGSSKRTVPLNQRAVELLAAYVEKYPPPTAGEWAGCVFLMPDGTPIGESTLDWALKSICRKAGLSEMHWHMLRHHYASVLIAGGESPRVVQKRLGHKNISTTLRIYTHLFTEAEEQTRSVLDDAWRNASVESPGASGTLPESGRANGRLAVVNA